MSTQLQSYASDEPEPMLSPQVLEFDEIAPDEEGAQISSTKGVPKTVSKIDKKIFQVTNKMRRKPQSFIKKFKKYATQFDGKMWNRGKKGIFMTHEGVAAINDAIEALENATPVKRLKWNDKLAAAAKSHTDDIGPKG